MTAPTPDEYFDRVWSTGDDPWEHGGRWYETRKYDLTIAALLRPTYGVAYEPGCGAGFLTQRLAPRCARLLAHERAPRGAEATRRRCAGLDGVEVSVGRIPLDWPAEPLDLVVLSEILYYLDDADLAAVIAASSAVLAAGGEVVAVHYRESVAEHARLGDDVHSRLRAALGDPAVTHREGSFLLEGFGTASSA